MKAKHYNAVDLLASEADRYHSLASALALATLIKPDPNKERKAREHLLRAETFRAAAALIIGTPHS